MYLWLIAILLVGVLIGGAALVLRARSLEERANRERRRRFTIQDTGERLPLAPERPERAPQPVTDDALPIVSVSQREPDEAPAKAPSRVQGRLVDTPDGEMILTNPPFELRESMFSSKSGRFINALSRRVPAWVMLCPRVRLDSLLIPTRPDGRDPRDWREWRKRVRTRSVDLVLCDRRTWKPLVAVLFESSRPIDARKIAGGQDRILDEVFAAAGLPLIRLAGQFDRDWALIEPYVHEAILPHMTDEQILEASARPARIDPDAAVTLLRMDQEKGWLLE